MSHCGNTAQCITMKLQAVFVEQSGRLVWKQHKSMFAKPDWLRCAGFCALRLYICSRVLRYREHRLFFLRIRYFICLKIRKKWRKLAKNRKKIGLRFFHLTLTDRRLAMLLTIYRSKTPHVVTVLWLDSDDVVTVRSPTSGTSGRLQNRVSVPPWFLHSDCVNQVPSVFPCSDCAVAC